MTGIERLFQIVLDMTGAMDCLREIGPEIAEEYGLRLDNSYPKLLEFRDELQKITQAAQILESGKPLATHFPNGGSAPEVKTPRQVIYLHELHPARMRERNREVFAERDEWNRYPKRPCQSATKDGSPCGNKSLRFIERPLCHVHADQVERETNKKHDRAWMAHQIELYGPEAAIGFVIGGRR